MQNKFGFTLIELLVVVLIIGILAAVALPKYELAVAKSRYTQLMINTHTIKEANQLYYMANGKYSIDLNDLDLELSNCEIAADGRSCHLAIEGDCFINDETTDGKGNLTAVAYCGRKGLFYALRYDSDERWCYARPDNELANKVCRSLGGTLTNVINNVNHYLLK